MKKTLLLCIVALIGLMYTSCKSKDKEDSRDPLVLYNQVANPTSLNTLTDEQRRQGWQLLFDGKTGNGWHGYNQKGIPDFWAVEDGCLTMNSTGGGEEQDIITDKIYKNFAFSVEYKLTRGANSGIIYQVKEDPKYTFPYETGPEFQIADYNPQPGGRPINELQIHGANYGMYAPMEKPYKPIDEWNRMLLLIQGNDVTHVLNGVVIVKYTKYSDDWQALRDSGKWLDFPDYSKFDEGHISLQNHGTKVWFRDIKIKEF